MFRPCLDFGFQGQDFLDGIGQVAPGGQGVGVFARLVDGDHQLMVVGVRGTVAVFAGDFDLGADAVQVFHPVAGDLAVMVAGAAGEDEDLVDADQGVFGLGAEDFGRNVVAGADRFQGVGQGAGLFEGFFLHEAPVGAQVYCIRGEFGKSVGAGDGSALGVGDAELVLGEFGQVAVFQVDQAASDLEQGRGV